MPEPEKLLPNLAAPQPGPKSAAKKAWPLGNTVALVVLTAAFSGAVFGFVAGFVASVGPVQQRILAALPEDLHERITGGSNAVSDANALLRGPQAAKDDERATIEVVLKAAPGVVSIIADKEVPVAPQPDPFADEDEFFRQFFGIEEEPSAGTGETERQRVSSGTGFFVSEDGYLVTNRHVVLDEEAEYSIVMADGAKHDAKVLARDMVNDIAVLKVDPTEGETFPVVQLGDSGNVKVGQTVIAIGYALGQFGNTVSRGIVSGLQRSIHAEADDGAAEDLLDVIQTDAAINPGNSGGPLLDLDGLAIGMNSAIVGGAQSIGFAIPIDDVRIVVDSVRATGRIQRPYLGIRYLMIDEALQEKNGLSADHGALVVHGDAEDELPVMPGSPAEKAGIVEDDIILSVDGQELSEKFPLAVAVRRHRVGDVIDVMILHDGEEKTVAVTLEERP